MRPVMIPEATVTIFKNLDVTSAKKLEGACTGPGKRLDGTTATIDDTVLAGIHEARIANPLYFTQDEVSASVAYLTAHGWKLPSLS